MNIKNHVAIIFIWSQVVFSLKTLGHRLRAIIRQIGDVAKVNIKTFLCRTLRNKVCHVELVPEK